MVSFNRLRLERWDSVAKPHDSHQLYAQQVSLEENIVALSTVHCQKNFILSCKKLQHLGRNKCINGAHGNSHTA